MPVCTVTERPLYGQARDCGPLRPIVLENLATLICSTADGELGRFRYVLDPEGTLLELWQPAE